MKSTSNAWVGPPLIAVAASVSFVFALVCGLTWITTAGDEFMPRLFQDSVHINPLNHRVGEATLLICAIALAVLWFRRSSVLDQWLMVVALAAISELVLAVTLVSGRFSLGLYAGGFFTGHLHHRPNSVACRDRAALFTGSSYEFDAAT